MTNTRYGTHGRVLVVDLTDGSSRVEEIEESVYQKYLGGYGLGAWLMWRHYETLIGFGANLLNDDLELITACHDACNRYGIDALSSSATLAWVCEAVERGILTAADLDGIDMRWGNGEAALALTIQMGTGEGCGAWLRHGSASAARHVGKGSEELAIHIRGQEPAYHDPRFSSLMGLTFVTDPTTGRHTAGGAS